jgi:hypothetical protein
MGSDINNVLMGASAKNTACRHCVMQSFNDVRNLLYLPLPIRFIAYGSVTLRLAAVFYFTLSSKHPQLTKYCGTVTDT